MIRTRFRPGLEVLRDQAAMLLMLARYWRTVFPVSRRELRRWERRAAAIPDAVLRSHALVTLREERGLCEGAALFATLAPRATRASAVRMLVALEVLCDYLDTLAEQPVADPLANGRTLHGALAAALGEATGGDWYALHPQQDDGGYVDALAERCADVFAGLPAAAAIAPVARRVAARSGEAQSRNHAAMLDPAGDVTRLAAWCGDLAPAETGLEWWELAAGACSSLTLIALLGAAADPAVTAADAARLGAAYFPWVSALSSLLDSLVDRRADAVSGSHSYVAHYEDADDAARRLAFVTRHAVAGLRALPRGRQHVAILAAMACFYLSGRAVRAGAGEGILGEVDIETGLLRGMLRVRSVLR